MKIERRDRSDERRILTGMIVDSAVLGRIAAKWTGKGDEGLFHSRWSNLVGGWCVRHFNKYGKAPRAAIEPVFENWSMGTDKETVGMVDKFLSGLSGEYSNLKKESNSEYLIDLSGSYFQRVQLTRLQDNIEAHLEAGEIEKSQKLVETFGKVE